MWILEVSANKIGWLSKSRDITYNVDKEERTSKPLKWFVAFNILFVEWVKAKDHLMSNILYHLIVFIRIFKYIFLAKIPPFLQFFTSSNNLQYCEKYLKWKFFLLELHFLHFLFHKYCLYCVFMYFMSMLFIDWLKSDTLIFRLTYLIF